MARRSRFQPILKWAGLVGLACLLVIWLLSERWYVGYVASTSSLSVSYGSLCYRSIHEESPGDARRYRLHAGLPVLSPTSIPSPTSRWRVSQIKRPGFHYRGAIYLQMNDKISIPFNFITRGTGLVTVSRCAVPISFIFLISATLTTILWFHCRRIPPGHCQRCGYNLTGNVSGVCSECGKPCEPDASAT